MFASRFTSPLVVLLIAAAGCAPPRVGVLPGALVPVQQLPRGTLPDGRRKIVFQWELRDGEISARGDGVSRIASPDSVRLDFFQIGRAHV